ncbi:MAG: aryl-sulfate sulfotransferase, partial [Planctomycetota bacterium]
MGLPNTRRALALGWLCCALEFCGTATRLYGVELIGEPTIALQPNAPLAALLEFSTDAPATARFRVRSDKEAWLVETQTARVDHSIPVMGLAPDATYWIDRLELSGGDAISRMESLASVTTAPLPDGFVGIKLLASQPERMEPGLTLFDSRGRAEATIVVDASGVVRWYMDQRLIGATLQANGRLGGLAFVDDLQEIQEYDLLGHRTASWRPPDGAGSDGNIPVADTAFFHHDQVLLENGNRLAIDRQTRRVAGFPTSDTDPNAPTATRPVWQDVIVEFSPDGGIVNAWDLAEMIDPLRIGHTGVREPPRIQNWSHVNAVVYDPGDGSIIVNSRHQDATIKFDTESGELQWILGTPSHWGPEYQPFLLTPTSGDDFLWPYHAHAPEIVPDDPTNPEGPDDPNVLRLLLHDNGNHRASAFETP